MNVTFAELTARLAHGQLKNTALVDDSDTGEINPGHEDQVLELVNQGLTDITTKKKLIEARNVLTFVTSQNIYTLDTAPAGDYENLVRLLSVEAVMTGNEVIEANKRSFIPRSNKDITQPSIDSIRFSDKFMTDYGPAVDLIFQKTHPVIDTSGSINLPPQMFEALILYVAGLYLSHMGGENNTSKGDSYYGLYLKMMGDDDIKNSSGTSEMVDDDSRFADRGFV